MNATLKPKMKARLLRPAPQTLHYKPSCPVETQKARGVLELLGMGDRNPFPVPAVQVATSALDVARIWATLPPKAKRFCRPCPKRPRHGFEESRLVSSLEEALGMFDRAKAADAAAEMLIMEPVDAVCSAVWSSGMLALGPGRDAATSGHGSFLFPTNDQEPVDGPFAAIRQSPFFEFVTGRSDGSAKRSVVPSIVQLRDGPTMPKVKDHVTRTTVVKEVLHAGGDHLLWEELMVERKGEQGLVIEHVGGTLVSHYAIHAGINDLPVVTTHVPQVGEVLEPTMPVKGTPNRAALVEGVNIALELDINRHLAGLVMLAGLHNFLSLDFSDPMQARWLGAACGFAVRLGFIAAIGEARHAKVSNQADLEALAGIKGKERNQIYVEGWANFADAKSRVRKVWRIFRTKSLWNGGAVGGEAWAKCTEAAVELWNATVAVRHSIGKTDDEAAKDLVAGMQSKLNRIVNVAHNTGWFLNKFLDTADFNLGVSNGAAIACKAQAGLLAVAQASAPEHDRLAKEKAITKPGSRTAKTAAVAAVEPKPLSTPEPVATKVLAAQCVEKGGLHVQYVTDATAAGGYSTKNVLLTPAIEAALAAATYDKPSMAGTTKKYASMVIPPEAPKVAKLQTAAGEVVVALID